MLLLKMFPKLARRNAITLMLSPIAHIQNKGIGSLSPTLVNRLVAKGKEKKRKEKPKRKREKE